MLRQSSLPFLSHPVHFSFILTFRHFACRAVYLCPLVSLPILKLLLRYLIEYKQRYYIQATPVYSISGISRAYMVIMN